MKKKLIKFSVLFVAMIFLALPLTMKAETAELISITPDATDISQYAGQDDDMPENTELTVFDGTIGQSYEIKYQVETQPAMVVITGGSMDEWTYDQETNIVTVNMECTGYVEGVFDFGPTNPFGVALIWAVGEDEDGPPEEMIGSWMATNLMTWNLIPPEDDQPYFGYELSGPDGETGFFEMYIPDSTIDMLSEMAGKELVVDDLAIFLDDDQLFAEIEEVEGGAEIFITITFKDNTTLVSQSSVLNTENVSKTVLVKKQKKLSIKSNKAQLKVKKKTILSGQLRSEKEGVKIQILSKKKNNTKYKKIATATTNAEGKWRKKVTRKKAGTYLYKVRTIGKKAKSSVKQIKFVK